ncbi:DUF4013 domain-containing protein [Methanocella arvoryzae]|uniref:DUF4013 domain-containing protein n=1 Tax=Methanocella arvoryzae (strain DSM 22066 / NBRC 105507 / MRE50) TaxID=351160 RepID=Q0W7U4_METAR|nr:DUF4013 domain-containing protein [Methanocella arvoryzae]CAJ35549.1 hypothetical protein RCIX30 [Methanocella arvoryzae MRE50]
MAIFATPLEVTLKYSLSNILSLFIGGLFFIPPLVAYFFLIIAAELFEGNEYLFLALFGLLFVLIPVCVALPGGYIIRCLRDRRTGSLRMPGFFGEPVKLLSDAFAFLVMAIVYMICFGLMFALLFTPIVFLPSSPTGFGFIAFIAFMFLFVALFAIVANVLFFTFFISLTIYAAEGSLISALNPVRVIKVLASNPLGFLVTLVLVYGIGSLLQILAIFLITMPWVLFFIMLIDALVVADVYLATERKIGEPGLTDQPAP